VTVDLHRAGGIPQVMKILLAHGVLHGDAGHDHGADGGRELAEVPSEPPAGQDVIRPWERPSTRMAIWRSSAETWPRKARSPRSPA